MSRRMWLMLMAFVGGVGVFGVVKVLQIQAQIAQASSFQPPPEAVTTITAAKLLSYDCGTAAGLMAGASTESTVIGTAGDTISRLDLPDDEKNRLLNNIPVAYAVSYLVGTGFVVWFLSGLAPRLLRVNLKAESG